MVVIEVLSVNGVVPDPPIHAELQAGDSMGRGEHNTLSLPDPERRVSRVHAQIAHRRGRVRIVARGSNPLKVDETVLEMGDETDLRDGARIEVGGYVLRARVR